MVVPRRRPVDDETDVGRWAISWADFLTLLFAFFVVMYGISTVNQEKYRRLSESLSQVFDRNPRPDAAEDPNRIQNPDDASGLFDGSVEVTPGDSVFIEDDTASRTARLAELRSRLSSDLDGLFEEGQVEIDGSALWFTIEIRSSLLFEAGDVIPAIEADPLLTRIAQALSSTQNPIHVEGYTDNQPIESGQFPSNWELSAARAAAVVRILQINGLPPERLAAVGYGQYRPAYSNRTPEGQSLNRRIVIVVSRDERVRRALMATGNEGVNDQTVRSLLVPETEDPNALEQTETETGIIFRRAELGEPQDP